MMEVMKILQDGRWHTASSISESLGLPHELTEKVIDFLLRYRFIEASGGEASCRMNRDTVPLDQAVKILEMASDGRLMDVAGSVKVLSKNQITEAET